MEVDDEVQSISNDQLSKLILSIINLDKNKESIFNAKGIILYLINKQFLEKIKNLINFQKIESSLNNNNSIDIKNVEKIINEYIENNINNEIKNELNVLLKEDNNINQDLIIKELLENKKPIFEIINEDIKNNLNNSQKKFIKLETHSINNFQYFTMEQNINSNKIIIMFTKIQNTFYEVIIIVKSDNYEELIKIIEEQKTNFLSLCNFNIDEINENNTFKQIIISNIEINLFITPLKCDILIQEKNKLIINDNQEKEQNIPKSFKLIKKEEIKNLFYYLNNSNNIFKKALNKNEGELHNNYSPCKIINRYWIENFINSFINIENINQNNLDIFNDYKLLIPTNISNNDIYITSEIFLISLFPFFNELENKRDLFNDYILYLHNGNGAIIIENEIYIFETLENDVNQRKYFLKIQNPNLFLEDMINGHFELDDINLTKLKSNAINNENQNNNINNNIIMNENNINQNENIQKKKNQMNGYEQVQNIQNSVNPNIFNNNIINNFDNYNNINNYNNPINNNIYNSYNLNFQNNIYNNNLINNNNNNQNNNLINLNNNIIPQQQITLDKFKSTIGLANIGATCYINSIIQCLAHCIELSEDILSWYLYHPDKDKQSRCISYSYADVLYNLFFPKDNQTYYSPNDFREIVALIGPLFEEHKANDSKDIFQFLIEKIHEELNVLNESNINYNEDIIVNQMDELAVFNNFELVCQKNYHSCISKYFYGKHKTITKCLNCQCSIFNYQVYSFLIFPLLDVKKYKFSYYQNHSQNQIMNLYDCFNYFQKMEFFSGENHIYCMGCKLETNANYCNLIYSTPIILTIILNRGKNNADFNEKFLFPMELNLDSYAQDKYNSNKFYLIGVLCHVGESSMNGHFFSYCRSHYQGNWFKYNDAIVSECDENEIFDATTPYILFYHKYL